MRACPMEKADLLLVKDEVVEVLLEVVAALAPTVPIID